MDPRETLLLKSITDSLTRLNKNPQDVDLTGLLSVSVSASFENRIPIYRDELDERSESKQIESVRSSSHSHSHSRSFLCGATSPQRSFLKFSDNPIIRPFAFIFNLVIQIPFFSIKDMNLGELVLIELINYIIPLIQAFSLSLP
jgi:hypothetical protein